MSSNNLRILIKQVAVDLPLGLSPAATACKISLTLETGIAGPFLGDSDDIDITIDYSLIVRHILQVLPGDGPFADIDALAEIIIAYVADFDGRIIGQRLEVLAGTDHIVRQWERA